VQSHLYKRRLNEPLIVLVAFVQTIIKVDELKVELDQLNRLLRDLIKDSDSPSPSSSVEGGAEMLDQIISIDGDTPKRARIGTSDTSELMNS
jgi:hypothetical protein